MPEETVEYAWTLLRLPERRAALLETYEIEEVYSNEPQPPVVPGVDRAIRLAAGS